MGANTTVSYSTSAGIITNLGSTTYGAYSYQKYPMTTPTTQVQVQDGNDNEISLAFTSPLALVGNALGCPTCGSGGGNPFNQNLNTSNSPTFQNLNIGGSLYASSSTFMNLEVLNNANATAFFLNYSDLGGVTGGFIPDYFGLPITDFGLNAQQFGTTNVSYFGDIFRMDVRPGTPLWSIKYQPTNGTVGDLGEFNPIIATKPHIGPDDNSVSSNLTNSSILIGTGWGDDNNVGIGKFGYDLQVYNSTYVGGKSELDGGNITTDGFGDINAIGTVSTTGYIASGQAGISKTFLVQNSLTTKCSETFTDGILTATTC